ncbi:hypothetical protein EI555_005602 [Monodon monoceros]|uniref:Major facilitator superfamily (MFS) profile domain-containing protein n=1 Tax=Monodon monoceros TaxID=40151 RepID=A0A4V5P7W5_MONMO|nr:hypothetical protein EI555_005602 [Monodon monoceros]
MASAAMSGAVRTLSRCLLPPEADAAGDAEREARQRRRNRYIYAGLGPRAAHRAAPRQDPAAGPRESGKSTFVKQMRIIHGREFDQSALLEFRDTICNNILKGSRVLVDARDRLGVPWQYSENEKQGMYLMAFENKAGLPVESATFQLLCTCSDHALEGFWHQGSFQPEEGVSAGKQDILLARKATKGKMEHDFVIKKIPFKVVDVGGQRSQRQKWFQCFDGITLILFMVSSSEYDQVLMEDRCTNRLVEPMNIFETIVNNKLFFNVSIVLPLNKMDLLVEKTSRAIPTGWRMSSATWSSISIRRDGIAAMHLTTAIHTENIRFVFHAVKDTILQENLKEYYVTMKEDAPHSCLTRVSGPTRFLTSLETLPVALAEEAAAALAPGLGAMKQRTMEDSHQAAGVAVHNVLAPESSPRCDLRPASGRKSQSQTALVTGEAWIAHPTWFSNAFSYYGLVLLTTELFQAGDVCSISSRKKAVEAKCSLACEYLSEEDYMDLLWTTLSEFPGVLVTLWIIDRLGRKKTMALCFVIFSLCSLLLFICVGRNMLTLLLFIARAFISGGFQAAYVYTPEVYPTATRALGLGTCSGMARVGALITPFIAQVMLESSVYLTLVVYSGCCLLAALASCFLPIETKGRGLQESSHREWGQEMVGRGTHGTGVARSNSGSQE